MHVVMLIFFLAYDEYEVSPYEELKLNLVRNIEMSRMASIMSGRVYLSHGFVPKVNLCASSFFYFLVYIALFSSRNSSSFLCCCGWSKPVSEGSPGLWPVREMRLPAVRICCSLHQASNGH